MKKFALLIIISLEILHITTSSLSYKENLTNEGTTNIELVAIFPQGCGSSFMMKKSIMDMLKNQLNKNSFYTEVKMISLKPENNEYDAFKTMMINKNNKLSEYTNNSGEMQIYLKHKNILYLLGTSEKKTPFTNKLLTGEISFGFGLSNASESEILSAVNSIKAEILKVITSNPIS